MQVLYKYSEPHSGDDPYGPWQLELLPEVQEHAELNTTPQIC